VVILLFLTGLSVGSFLNVLIDRLPKGETVVRGRSHCDFCKKTLRWYELIPVLSFVLQGAKCRRCGRTLSWQYPAIELVTAAGFLAVYMSVGATVVLIPLFILISSAIVITVADLKYQIIPDSMAVASLIATLFYLFFSVPSAGWLSHAETALATATFFYLLWYATHGRGMGFGDVKLSFVIGLLLGFPETLFALYGAFLTGAAAGVILILQGKKSLKSKIAFGPFLIFATAVSIIFREEFFKLWTLL